MSNTTRYILISQKYEIKNLPLKIFTGIGKFCRQNKYSFRLHDPKEGDDTGFFNITIVLPPGILSEFQKEKRKLLRGIAEN